MTLPGLSPPFPERSRDPTKSFGIVNDQKFVLDWLEQQHILAVQGTGFNWIKPDHFRITFLPNLDDLASAMDKLQHFLEHYHQ